MDVMPDRDATHRPPPPLSLPRGKGRSGRGLGGSLLVHGLLLLLLFLAHERGLELFLSDPAAGELRKAGGGGGGGGRIAMVSLPPASAPPKAVATPPPVPTTIPVPVPEVTPVAVEPVAVEVAQTPVPSAAAPSLSTGSSGTGSGGGSGSGVGTGNGSGVGPGSGSGTGGGGAGGGARPPEPRQVILPPLDFPKVMRGRTVAVTFWVGVDGRVDKVVMEPEIPDRGFARKFEEVMRNYRFRPARSAEGESIPGTTTVSVTF